MLKSRRYELVAGALFGALAWVVYGCVETWFLVVQPWLLDRYTVLPMPAGTGVAALAGYTTLGAGLGAAAALLHRIAPDRRQQTQLQSRWGFHRKAGTATVCLGLAVSAFASGLNLYAAWAVGLAVVVLAVGPGSRRRQLRFLTSPWVPPLLLIYPPWIAGQITVWGLFSSSVRVLAAGGMVLAVCIAAWTIQALRDHRRPQLDGSLGGAAIRLVVVGSVAMALSAVGPIPPPPVVEPGSAAPAPAGKPNVILIVLDTVRADHLSAYGYARDTTPNLRAFASEATLYSRAISTSNYSLPSHASLLTGQYGSRHGARRWPEYGYDAPLGAGSQTLPEILLERGFSTAAVFANYGFLSHRFGLARGFSYFDARPLKRVGFPRYTMREGLSLFATLLQDPVETKGSRSAAAINAEVLAAIDRRDSTARPFFLVCNYMDAHITLLPPPPFDRLFVDAESVPPRPSMSDGRPRFVGGPAWSEENRDTYVARYDGAIAYLDSELGHLFDRLRRRGLFDESLILVTSDHGEALGERGFWGHGESVDQEQIHVPLIVKYPGQRRGAVVHQTVSGVDVMPTVLGVLGYPVPNGVQGRDLTSPEHLDDRRGVFAEHFGNPASLGPLPIVRTILVGSRKLVLFPSGKREVFDLAVDPHETTDLYDPTDPLHGELHRRLAQWVRNLDQPPRRSPRPDQDVIDRLRSLGYIR